MSNKAAAKARKARERAARQVRRTMPQARRINGALKDSETGETVSIERETVTTPAEVDARMALTTSDGGRAGLVKYYREREGMDEAAAETAADGMRAWLAERARDVAPEQAGWDHINALSDVSLTAAVELWLKVQEFAADELESGRRAAQAIGHTSPVNLARYLTLRDKLIDDWQPTGSVEGAMLEMLAQSFSLYLYWTQIAHARAVEVAEDMERGHERADYHGWKSPYQHQADAIDQAHTMADRYNRMFLRVLRQLRDLRRYSPPIIVNNGGQVNLANQQVNVSETKT